MPKLLEYESTVVERAKLGVPPSVREVTFVAFVVRLSGSDEFLHRYLLHNNVSTWIWTKSRPAMASRFPRLKRANQVAAEKEGAEVAVLFETPRQFLVLPIEADLQSVDERHATRDAKQRLWLR